MSLVLDYLLLGVSIKKNIMSKTILFGGSGFFGPVILNKDKDIISIGRTPPPKESLNQHIYLKYLI